jgi:hypothetical protein
MLIKATHNGQWQTPFYINSFKRILNWLASLLLTSYLIPHWAMITVDSADKAELMD